MGRLVLQVSNVAARAEHFEEFLTKLKKLQTIAEEMANQQCGAGNNNVPASNENRYFHAVKITLTSYERILDKRKQQQQEEAATNNGTIHIKSCVEDCLDYLRIVNNDLDVAIENVGHLPQSPSE